MTSSMNMKERKETGREGGREGARLSTEGYGPEPIDDRGRGGIRVSCSFTSVVHIYNSEVMNVYVHS